MRTNMLIAAAVSLACALGTPALAQQAMPAGVKAKEVVTTDGPVKILGDAKGMTLYTCDLDAPGKPACSGQAWSQFWPPLAAAADAKPAGAWTVIDDAAGKKQWAYKGKPLYTFVKDTQPHNFDGHEQPKDKPIWHWVQAGK